MLDYFEYCKINKLNVTNIKEIEMKKFPSPFDLVSTTECVAPAVVCKIDCCEDMPLKRKNKQWHAKLIPKSSAGTSLTV